MNFHIDEYGVAEYAGVKLVDLNNALDIACDVQDFGLVFFARRAVNELVDRGLKNVKSDLKDKQRHNKDGDFFHDVASHKDAAYKAYQYGDGCKAVRTAVPSVGFENVGLDFFGIVHTVPKKPFLNGNRDYRNAYEVNIKFARVRRDNSRDALPNQKAADAREYKREKEYHKRFDFFVSVVVSFVLFGARYKDGNNYKRRCY